jgi:hypothetical protein
MGMGGPSLDIPTDLKVNSSNEIIISGFLRESIDLDPSENEVLLESESGIGSSFLAKYSLEGDLLFAHLIAGDEICTAEEISIDANDNILVGGVFNYAMDLDPSADTVLVNTNSSSDVFLIKLSSDGSFLWGDTFGGDSYERNFGIETTDNEEIILSFHTKSQGFVLGSTGDSEFITEPSKSTVAFFDTEGVFLWGFNIGDEEPANDLIVRDVVSKGPIDFYIAGYYEGESDFTPWNPSESSLAASGMKDAFIAKYRDCDNTFSSVEVYACDSLVSPSGALTWTESGVYQEALVNAAGCDSVISTELTIVSDSLITQQIVSCDSYLWALDSTVYTESGTYYRDLVGCDEDSAILELEIPELISTTMEQACGSFTWDINGNTYIESGVYVDTLANELGCDSLFILDLIVTSINTAVIQNGITLNASLEEASYQWLDCSDDFEPLLNETSQNFTPDENGIYAVEITQDGCTDTSYCYQIVDVGIEPTSGSFFRIFPNPTEGLIFIEQNENSSKHAGIWLYSATGVLLREEKFKSTKELDLTVYPKGIYFLKLVSGESIRYERIVKK